MNKQQQKALIGLIFSLCCILFLLILALDLIEKENNVDQDWPANFRKTVQMNEFGTQQGTIYRGAQEDYAMTYGLSPVSNTQEFMISIYLNNPETQAYGSTVIGQCVIDLAVETYSICEEGDVEWGALAVLDSNNITIIMSPSILAETIH